MMVLPAVCETPAVTKAHDFVSLHRHRRRGKTAGNDLAEDGNICRNAEGGLRTAHAKTEAGNDFVHNQQDTVLVTQFANLLMIAKLHGNTAGILTDGFYDEGSGAAVFFIFLKTLAPARRCR